MASPNTNPSYPPLLSSSSADFSFPALLHSSSVADFHSNSNFVFEQQIGANANSTPLNYAIGQFSDAAEPQFSPDRPADSDTDSELPQFSPIDGTQENSEPDEALKPAGIHQIEPEEENQENSAEQNNEIKASRKRPRTANSSQDDENAAENSFEREETNSTAAAESPALEISYALPQIPIAPIPVFSVPAPVSARKPIPSAYSFDSSNNNNSVSLFSSANISPAAANSAAANRFSSSILPAYNLSHSHSQQHGSGQLNLFSSSSPAYSYSHSHGSPHIPTSTHSPSLGPTAAPHHRGLNFDSLVNSHFTPSSPRFDSIPLVTQRLEFLQRSGKLGTLFKNLAEFNHHSATPQPNKTPTYQANSASRTALIAIDKHLRRRFIFSLLDADMIVKGIVYNKTSVGLIISITEICDKELIRNSIKKLQSSMNSMDPIQAAYASASLANLISSSVPLLSSCSDERDDQFDDLDELQLQGECHMAEIQAALKKQSDSAPAVHSSEITMQMSQNRSATQNGGVRSSGNLLTIPVSQPSFTATEQSAILEHFSVGDPIKALVISVDVHSEKIYLSMNNARLRTMKSTHKLGIDTEAARPLLLTKPSDSPSHANYSTPAASAASSSSASLFSSGSNVPYGFPFAGGRNSYPSLKKKIINNNLNNNNSSDPHKSSSSSSSTNYCNHLRSLPIFKNPESIQLFLSAYRINPSGSLFNKPFIDPADKFTALRKEQNQSWAKESVVKGITLAKRGNYETAMKCYSHALDIEPNFTQAFVARGACFVLQNQYAEAIKEFEKALEIDPKQPYAAEYAQACRDKLAKAKNSNAEENKKNVTKQS